LRPGDYLLEAIIPGNIQVYLVRDFVALRRLVPYADDQLVDQKEVLDSERPAYMDQVFCLLTAFAERFRSIDEAIRAVGAAERRWSDALATSTSRAC